MLLLPKTPPLTYPNMKRFKGPKKHHFTHSLTSLTSLTFFTSQSLASLVLVSGGGGRRREEMASSLTIKESFKANAARARLARGF